MKRFLSYILILVVIMQLFAPFSIGVNNKKLLLLENKIEAEGNKSLEFSAENNNLAILAEVKAVVTNKTITFTVDIVWKANTLLSIDHKIVAIKKLDGTENGEIKLAAIKENPNGDGKDVATVVFDNLNKNETYSFDILVAQKTQSILERTSKWFNPGYYLGRALSLDEVPIMGKLFKINDDHGVLKNQKPYEIKTLDEADSNIQRRAQLDESLLRNESSFLPQCSASNLGGCVGIVLYRLLYQPSAYFFAITGKILDYTFFYSVQDSSYRSSFVAEGWSVVRDLCNMFFIFILLYIAFQVILGMKKNNPKELIVKVIIVGIFINFSLFATHLLIDASNIMARVFYNKITVGTVQGEKVVGDLGYGGSKQISEVIVSKVNPQQIIISSEKASSFKPKGVDTYIQTKGGVDNSTFIMLTLAATAMNVFGFWVFFTIAIVFVTRVVGLWVSMILSPLAFLSFTIPELKKVQMVGWSNWWSELISLSFLAPVFMFFIYIIILFLETGLGMTQASNEQGINFYVAAIVPFVFLMILLKRAKDLTVKMGGEFGSFAAKIGSSVAGGAVGLGLGALTGGAALAMRSTLGRAGASIANSDKLKEAEAKGGISGFGAKTLRNIGSYTGKAGFDFRNTKLGATANSSLGKEMNADMGKGKTGGYSAYQEKISKETVERAETLRLSPLKAAEQDKKAKEYKKEYEEAMYTKRLEEEKAGNIFDEKAFRVKYEEGEKDAAGNVIVEGRGPKVKTSEEVYRERVGEYKKSTSEFGPLGANANTMAKIDKDLGAKTKDDKAKEVTAYDKYKANKKIDVAESVIKKTKKVKEVVEKELAEIEKTLSSVAKEIGGGLTRSEIKPEHIKKIIENRQKSISEYETKEAVYKSQIQSNPNHPTAQSNLASVLKYKKKAESEINRYSSVLSNKTKAEEKKEDQEEKIKNQVNIKAEQQDIIDGK